MDMEQSLFGLIVLILAEMAINLEEKELIVLFMMQHIIIILVHTELLTIYFSMMR
jgi:hypothetical protein